MGWMDEIREYADLLGIKNIKVPCSSADDTDMAEYVADCASRKLLQMPLTIWYLLLKGDSPKVVAKICDVPAKTVHKLMNDRSGMDGATAIIAVLQAKKHSDGAVDRGLQAGLSIKQLAGIFDIKEELLRQYAAAQVRNASATPSLFSGADQAHLEKKNAEYKAGAPEFKEHSLLDEQ